MLSERISGENWFYRIQDPDEQVQVAQDFIRNLAALHRLDPHDLALPSFGPVKTVREHALDEIANMRRRATQPSGDIDPLAAPQPRLAGAQRARLRRPGRLRPGRHRPRQLHVRERQGHRGRRLGARPLRRPDGRHRVALVAHRPGHVHALPRPAARVREALGQPDRRATGLVLPALRRDPAHVELGGRRRIGRGAPRRPARGPRHRERRSSTGCCTAASPSRRSRPRWASSSPRSSCPTNRHPSRGTRTTTRRSRTCRSSCPASKTRSRRSGPRAWRAS